MKSNERHHWEATLAVGVTMAACAFTIGRVRPWLADHYHELHHVDDVYALPTPEQTVGISLGYRSALADLIYANTLLGYGIHTQEKRRFEFASNYLETCIALDPKLREVYYFADTILTLQSTRPRDEDFDKAREIQARGRKEFPYDAELWLVTGQFLSYLAPGMFSDADRRREWQAEGARVMSRACELAAGEGAMTRKCYSAARTLTREGEREAVIRLLERVIALTDDEEVRQRAQAWLDQHLGESVRQAVVQRQVRLEGLHERDLPFVSRELFMLLGPPFDGAACAGRSEDTDAECATSWQMWVEAEEAGTAK